MKILVTGASGFIGKNLLLALNEQWQVIATYWRAIHFPDFVSRNNLKMVVPLQVDLSSADDIDKISRIHQKFDCCVYLAASGDPAVSVNNPAFDLVSNTLTLVNLLEKIQFGTFIYFSSGAVYDGLAGPVSPEVIVKPRLPYAISHLTSEYYLSHFQARDQIRRFFIVRFFGAYGPYEPPRKIYSRLVKRFGCERNPQFTIHGDGKNKIDAMYIDDAIRAVSLLIESQNNSATFDLYSGQALTLTELVEKAAAIFQITPEITYTGSVPEYIEFYSTDRYFFKRYEFTPSIPPEEGLINLYSYLNKLGDKRV